MSWNDEEVNKLFSKFRQKAMVNKEFREKLLANPKGTIEDAVGKKMPDDFKIQIIEGDPSANLAFVLPPMVQTEQSDQKELSDEDLENVAGGACGADMSPCLGNVCGAAR